MTDSAHGDHTIGELLQSLLVAFVFAMTVRAFVAEGFVIPTGSMAPTLLGQHFQSHSPQTGRDFPVGVDLRSGADVIGARYPRMADPLLGPDQPGSGVDASRLPRTDRGQLVLPTPRMGDRIIVHKSLFLAKDPDRYDVVVFKNPTNPNGPDGNYIKRLVGLPEEAIWLVDGDVFVAPATEDLASFGARLDTLERAEAALRREPMDGPSRPTLQATVDAARAAIKDLVSRFEIRRKPWHVQRAVWQAVADADEPPRRVDALEGGWRGPPWFGEGWAHDGTAWRHASAEASLLEWEPRVRSIDDWGYYNQLTIPSERADAEKVADVRIAATVVADAPGLDVELEIEARKHQYRFRLGPGVASVRMRSREWGDEFPDQGWTESTASFDGFAEGRPVRVEFWHCDQRLAIFVDDERLVELEYDWSPSERLDYAVGPGDLDDLAGRDQTNDTFVHWRTSGAPLALHRLRVDRDLHYRSEMLVRRIALRNATNPGYEPRVRDATWACASHPRNLALLGPDEFFMLGDNSPASSDSRLWGNPHPVVARQFDKAPFVVHRDLLLGKAWLVYFPGPMPLSSGGRNVIPNLGAMRFIR